MAVGTGDSTYSAIWAFCKKELPLNANEVAAIDEYWRAITRNEEFIQQWGHNPRPELEGRWHQDLEDAYSQVRPAISSVSRPRMFHGLPGGLNPLVAENAHQALMLVLNPPERWFGSVGMLNSPEYLELKRAVTAEENAVATSSQNHGSSDADTAPLEGLNDTAIALLQAMNRQEPRTWREIAQKSGYAHDVVRRYSTSFQRKKLIKNIGNKRGFVRLVRLAEDCDSD